MALHADALGVTPRGIYFTALAVSVVMVRPFSGPLADRIGHLQVLVPSLLLTFVGLALPYFLWADARDRAASPRTAISAA